MIIELSHYISETEYLICSWEVLPRTWESKQTSFEHFISNVAKTYPLTVEHIDKPFKTTQIIVKGIPNSYYFVQDLLKDYLVTFEAQQLII